MQPFEGGEPGHTAEPILRAVAALPIAAVLGAALAFRPVRRGTPPRKPAVIQTQIVLAIIGALVMIVVGASLARAFGIAGAASLGIQTFHFVGADAVSQLVRSVRSLSG